MEQRRSLGGVAGNEILTCAVAAVLTCLLLAEGVTLLALRMMAPVLVAATIGVFVTGVALLMEGHKSDTLLLLHKASFIVWGAVFGIHFLAYLPRMLRSLRADWTARRRHAVGGAGVRATLVASALGAGVALALVLLPTIDSWQASSF
jgi:hypothetical protein